jgi:hypothetical protein
MRFGKLSLAAVAALSLVSAPVMAETASAASKVVGVSKVKRVGAASKNESKQASSGLLIGLAAAAAVIVGIVVLSDDNSTSP